MNGAYSTTDTAHYIFFDVRVGGCGDLTEGLSANSTRKIPITDPN